MIDLFRELEQALQQMRDDLSGKDVPGLMESTHEQ